MKRRPLNPPLVKVRLYGHLKQRFGHLYHFAIRTPREAISALSANLPGFEAYLAEHSMPGYRVIVAGQDRTEEQLVHPLFGATEIRIVPVMAGAKSDGVQMIAGAALIIAGTIYQFPMLTNMGVTMMMGGVAQMLAPSPNAAAALATSNGAEKSGGKFFDGPTNTYGQGPCIPVLYGELEVGGHVISASSAPETYARGANGGAFSGGNGIGGYTGNADTTPQVWSINPS